MKCAFIFLILALSCQRVAASNSIQTLRFPTDISTISTAENTTDHWAQNFTEFYNATVNIKSDNAVVDINKCAPGAASGQCTLRNAVAYCASKLTNATVHCVVHLPMMAVITVKSSEISVANCFGNFTILGHGSTISSFPSVTDYGVFRMNGAGSDNQFYFNVHNMTIKNFGSIDDPGGAIWVGNLGSGFFEHLIFRGCKGRDGGGIDIQSSINVLVFHCEFYDNYAIGNGGGLAIGERNDGIIVKNCIFLDNRAVELGYIGGGFGGKSQAVYH